LELLASVSIDDVRDVINISDAEISDEAVAKMIKRAEVTLELELGREIDSDDCLDAEKEFITVLASVYAICYLTGGSAVGLDFSVGDQKTTILTNAPPLNVLQGELERMLNAMKTPQLGVA
jgi:hypothetical protein